MTLFQEPNNSRINLNGLCLRSFVPNLSRQLEFLLLGQALNFRELIDHSPDTIDHCRTGDNTLCAQRALCVVEMHSRLRRSNRPGEQGLKSSGIDVTMFCMIGLERILAELPKLNAAELLEVEEIVLLELCKKQKAQWPDFAARRKLIFPDGPPPGKPLSEVVDEARGLF